MMTEAFQQIEAKLDDLRSALSQVRGKIAMARASDPAEVVKAPAIGALENASAELSALRYEIWILRKGISDLETRVERAERQASEHKVKRADTSARLQMREKELQAIRTSALWRTVKPIWKLAKRGTLPPESNHAGDLAFAFDLPQEWTTSRERLLIKGWCFSKSGRDLAGVRAKVGSKGRMARYGLERPDIAQIYGDSSAARFSGFTVEVDVPIGRSAVRLEAIEQGGVWEPFFEHELVSDRQLNGAERNGDRPWRSSKWLPQAAPTSLEKMVELLTPALRDHAHSAGDQIVFSVITPTHNTKAQWLTEAALSLIAQTNHEWQWCIVDDGSTSRETRMLLEQLSALTPRISVQFAEQRGISAATNQALEAARGDFVCFLDHDDLLAPEALDLVVEAFDQGFDVVYSDEDKLEEKKRKLLEAFYKPDWSPEYFRGVMYVGHLLSLRREVAQKVRFDSGFDGIQDYEFMLRVSETGARIGHVSEVLYHWRKTPGSVAAKTDAKPHLDELQERAVSAHLGRLNLAARAERTKIPHRLKIVAHARRTFPPVSLIIPTRDAPHLLGPCLESLEKTSYPDFEVILVDNETSDPEALALMERHPVRRIPFDGAFNFSRAINKGAEAAAGQFLVFLNNDTEIMSSDWIEHLLYYAEQADVGASSPLLVYEDQSVQHAGVVLGMRGTADHVMRGFPPDVDGYAGSLACAREVSAVTAACMMMRKSLFEEIGRMNEHFFTAYQDLDLCLRLRERGKRIIYTPHARVVHHESMSRQRNYDMIDRMLLLDQWERVITSGDPYYNRNLHLERGDYSAARSSA